jgi:hypothetical protein
MSFMPACSVHEACTAAAPFDDAPLSVNWTSQISPDPKACSPISLVATVCTMDTGMTNMAGCQKHYKPMCRAKGSVVEQCRENQGVAELPTTTTINDAVRGVGWRAHTVKSKGFPGRAGPGAHVLPR